MSSKHKGRQLQLLLGSQILTKINHMKVLVVGAGGIGCELVKNLSKSGYKNITILDFDNIEVTNLNRQFYFRKAHISQSKAKIVKTVLQEYDSSLNIQAIAASIYDSKFGLHFFENIDLVFSCLDNMKAREHLAAQATKYGKPLIDAGTMSYNGQTYASIRFKTSCHNCSPSHSEQSLAYCTIRSHPQMPIHCATYAKNFYDSFFGINHAEALSDELKYQRYVNNQEKQLSDFEMETIACKLFKEMFDIGIKDIDLEGNKIDLIRKLRLEEAPSLTQIVKNPEKSTFSQEEHNQQIQSPYREDKLWSISDYYLSFTKSVIQLLRRKLKNECPTSFQKDDEDCMNLILSITNLRTYNFINHNSEYNKHKYLTYYQCKDLIGKVFPAIASTNAIAAALQTRQALNIISERYNKLRYISFSNRSEERLSPTIQCGPSLQCQFCSNKIVYGRLKCNMKNTTFEELEQFTKKHFFTKNKDISHGSLSIIKNSGASSPNKKKMISFVAHLIYDGVLELKFSSDPITSRYTVYISLINSEDINKIQIIGKYNRKNIFDQIKQYFIDYRHQVAQNQEYEISGYGGYEV